MATIVWDKIGERVYETGVDHGVLYLQRQGEYSEGYGWNGLVSVSENPSGAEANAQYADNIKYLNLISAEEFGATIEAFTYPEEFGECDGTAQPLPGLQIGQQPRKSFGLSYRTLIGNDTEGTAYGYKIHLVYGAMATPSQKAYNTVNESPEAITFSWEVTTTAVAVENFAPTATVNLDSTKFAPEAMARLEAVLYGTAGADPRLPLPDEVVELLTGGQTPANPTPPNFDAATNTITIPEVTGVNYYVDGSKVEAGELVITEDTIVEARPKRTYVFPNNVDTDWGYTYTV